MSVKLHSTFNGIVQRIISFTVKITESLAPDEYVGLTGNAAKLGNWSRASFLRLNKHLGGKLWSTHLELDESIEIQYRYLIYAETEDGSVFVKRWETSRNPRIFGGQKNVDTFGMIDGVWSVHRPCLAKDERILQIKIFNDALNLVTKGNNVCIKLLASCANCKIEFCEMSFGKSELKEQPEEGVKYESNSIIVFHIFEWKHVNHKCAIKIMGKENPIGVGEFSSEDLKRSEGELSVDIKDENGCTIGAINLLFLVITPLQSGPQVDLHATLGFYWRKSWTKLDIGHRGMGASFREEGPPFIENTIAAFKQCASSRADFIEMDVHLTKDLVPVVYHDFDFFLANVEVPKSQQDLTKANVKDMVYKDLIDTAIFHVIGKAIVPFSAANKEKRKDHRLFPKLKEVISEMKTYKGVGIDLEIKWPQSFVDGSSEAEQTIDKNKYVDVILETIMESAEYLQEKVLIITSFDADICTMARFKQTRYPVMFLSLGRTTKWPAYRDPRCNDTLRSISNAQVFELIGTGAHTEDILRDPDIVNYSIDVGQVMFLWGDDSNCPSAVTLLKETGIHGLIYDRVEQNIPEDKVCVLLEK